MYMGRFPKIGVPPKLSMLIGFSIVNHPFGGSPLYGNSIYRSHWIQVPSYKVRLGYDLGC